jgi:uncharacterized protein (TIGR02271 family)
MTSTIVGYFDDYAEARRAESELIEAGFSEDVRVVAQNDGLTTPENTRDESWWDRVKETFGFADERELGRYQQAAQRGTLLTVRVPDAKTDLAAEILERHNPVDIDQRASTWEEGKQTLTGVGAAQSTVASAVDTAESASIPLAQEELTVGKRSVSRGALRVHTYVTERPVEEQVTLREEQAFVERTPVDRPATAGEAAFQERTVEVEERGEEAVVAKQARVVEEVKVGKQQGARTETVHDTVRKTEVAVDRDGRPRGSKP